MSDAHEDIRKHTKMYIGVFVALAVFTVLTVAASRVDLGAGINMGVALLIAGVKASLVAAIFMHLKWEKSISIWWVLVVCAMFFAALMLLPLFSMTDTPPGVRMGSWG